MTEKIGPWHVLTVSWSKAEEGEIWTALNTSPAPEGEDVEWHYELEHPEECGKACPYCLCVPACNLEYERTEIGLAEFFEEYPEDRKLQPGKHLVRHILEHYYDDVTTYPEFKSLTP